MTMKAVYTHRQLMSRPGFKKAKMIRIFIVMPFLLASTALNFTKCAFLASIFHHSYSSSKICRLSIQLLRSLMVIDLQPHHSTYHSTITNLYNNTIQGFTPAVNGMKEHSFLPVLHGKLEVKIVWGYRKVNARAYYWEETVYILGRFRKALVWGTLFLAC